MRQLRHILILLALMLPLAAFSVRDLFLDPSTPRVPDGAVTLKNGAEIDALLARAAWVSPGLDGKPVYMISFRTCPDCVRFKKEAFPKLHAAKIDTRVIAFARPNLADGTPKSRVGERAAIAEIWLHRNWGFFNTWSDIPVDAYDTLPDRPIDAESDPARAAKVDEARRWVADMRAALAKNGVQIAYPTLLWQRDGKWRVCMCETDAQTRQILKELGVRSAT